VIFGKEKLKTNWFDITTPRAVPEQRPNTGFPVFGLLLLALHFLLMHKEWALPIVGQQTHTTLIPVHVFEDSSVRYGPFNEPAPDVPVHSHREHEFALGKTLTPMG
jgi:hypothetical protein